MNKNIPAVSIIIPMYNAEKYIGECLDSIFAQTFTDFEVIVVDDASTDNSCSIIESYIEKQKAGGTDKLNLVHSKKNSGIPGIPRNIGIRFAAAEYLMFVDSDDVLTPTALEELYTVANEFDADVVYCEKYYRIDVGEKFTTDKSILTVGVGWGSKYDFVSKPTLESDNFAERIQDFCDKKFWTAPWNYLFRRSLIVQNDIRFPVIKIGEDEIFDLNVICNAKNIVRVPNIIYIWRRHNEAFSVKPETIQPTKTIEKWVHSIFVGIGLLDAFCNSIDSFKNYPQYKYRLFDSFIVGKIRDILPLFAKIPAWQLDELIRRELEGVKDKTALTAFLFSRMNVFNLQLNRHSVMIQQMNAQIQQKNKIIEQQQTLIQQLQSQIQK